jgi:hypothetical protein
MLLVVVMDEARSDGSDVCVSERVCFMEKGERRSRREGRRMPR